MRERWTFPCGSWIRVSAVLCETRFKSGRHVNHGGALFLGAAPNQYCRESGCPGGGNTGRAGITSSQNHAPRNTDSVSMQPRMICRTKIASDSRQSSLQHLSRSTIEICSASRLSPLVPIP